MLLSIQDLQVAFRLGERGAKTVVNAVQGVSFDIPENSTLALVGESGSGKSVTAMSILNLLPDNAQRSGRSSSLTCGRISSRPCPTSSELPRLRCACSPSCSRQEVSTAPSVRKSSGRSPSRVGVSQTPLGECFASVRCRAES